MQREKVKELIERRRRQLAVHSYLYYRLDESIISDHKFDAWAMELVDLQNKYPKIAATAIYAEYFGDFDGSTGYDLPTHLPEIRSMAHRALNYHKELLRNEQSE